jgi:futalosine hydrolase
MYALTVAGPAESRKGCSRIHVQRALFLAAFPPEIAALDPSFDRATVGVGLVEAALGAAAVIAERAPRHVVLLGTVGAYPAASLAIGDVVTAERVVVASSTGAIVEAMPASAAAAPIANARRVVVATTLSITTDDGVAASLEKETGAHVEHLEAFAVARACERAGVKFSAVFGVANIVGSRGRDQWREHHERAAAAACALFRSPTTTPSPA